MWALVSNYQHHRWDFYPSLGLIQNYYPFMRCFMIKWFLVLKSCLTIEESLHFHQVVDIFFGLLLIFLQTKDKLVKITSWLDFWYKDTKIYEKPSKKSTRNKVQWPKDTYNSSRNIIKPTPPCTWWDWEVVDNIDIAKKDMDERYLVAFHAC